MNKWIPQNQEKVHAIVEDLYKFGGLKPAEIAEFREYRKELENNKQTMEFIVEQKHAKNPELIVKAIAEVEAEIKWCDQTFIYKSDYASLFNMNQLVDHLFRTMPDDAFFDFKQLVEWVNAYFKIENPYKPANKIAYGWNFSLQKGQQAFRPYLYGCIRNYLNKNGVAFKTVELQKICALKIVDTNGE